MRPVGGLHPPVVWPRRIFIRQWHIVIPSATHMRRAQPRASYAATYSKRRSISYIGDSRVSSSATAWWPSVRKALGLEVDLECGEWGGGCRKLSESHSRVCVPPPTHCNWHTILMQRISRDQSRAGSGTRVFPRHEW